jgi:rod shape-determining protein MreC
MRNLLFFLVKYGPTFLFIFLQILCFTLILNNNEKQSSIFVNSTNLFAGYLNQKTTETTNFLNLDEENEQLRKDKAGLLQRIINSNIRQSSTAIDSIDNQYTLISSKICSKTINLRNNYFTLCKGKLDGIEKGMGVISDKSVMGIVKDVSDHYASVITVLHSQSRISIGLKNKVHHGTLHWDTSNPLYATAYDIRKYADIKVGDTIVTSGYSTIFPKNLDVGIVEFFEIEGGGETFKTRVKLLDDFNTVSEVYVINSLLKNEFDSLSINNE